MLNVNEGNSILFINPVVDVKLPAGVPQLSLAVHCLLKETHNI